MRPEDFSPGNRRGTVVWSRHDARFNEAGGFLPRKQSRTRFTLDVERLGFNEAGGFLPRKR